MGLPTSRDETATPGGIVRSALINSIEDWLIAAYALAATAASKLSINRTVPIGLSSMVPAVPSSWKISDDGFAWERTLATGAAAPLFVDIPTMVSGDRLATVYFYVNEVDITHRSALNVQLLNMTGAVDLEEALIMSSGGPGIVPIINGNPLSGACRVDDVYHRVQVELRTFAAGVQVLGGVAVLVRP